MLSPVLTNPWVQAACVLGGIVLFCLACYVLSPVLVSLFLAFFVAYVLNPVVDVLERRRVRRSWSVAAFGVMGILLLLCIPLFLIPSLVFQAKAFVMTETGQAGVSAQWASRLLDALPLEDWVRGLGWVEPDAEHVDALAVLRERAGAYLRDVTMGALGTYAPQLAGVGQKVGSGLARFLGLAGRGTVSLVMFLANLALFTVIAGYLLKDFHGLIAGAKELVPPRYRDKTCDVIGKIDLQLRSFLRGQLLVSSCLGVLYATGLLVFGVPFAVLIGAFGALASFLPYVGIALTAGSALLLTFIEHGVDWRLLGVVLTFVVAQFLEGTVLTPRIVGSQVGLSPVWVILAILVFGSLLGFLGLLLAVPIAASLKVLVVEGVAYYKRSPMFEEGGSAGRT